MKYANSLKYMNSFATAEDSADISLKRVRDLCEGLGRINIGISCIVLPKSAAAHACALMLEAVIKNAGYNVGRITSHSDYDSRSCVFINREIPSIEDYNKCVGEIKNIIKRFPDESFSKQEISFTLSLLLCRMADCKYVILEGLGEDGMNFDAICAPYDLIVVPTVYDTGHAEEKIKISCETIRRGTREVISGNQRSDIYNKISNACAMSGVRLYIPAKAQFEILEASPRKLSFSYGGRDSYMLRSPSYMLRDCSITVIEAALAIRRAGVKLPWGAITSGLSEIIDSGCFDMISASPRIICDSAETKEELELVLKTSDELWGIGDISLCADARHLSADSLAAFSERKINRIIAISDKDIDINIPNVDSVVICKGVKEAVKEIKATCSNENLLCFGGVSFCASLKKEYSDQMGL